MTVEREILTVDFFPLIEYSPLLTLQILGDKEGEARTAIREQVKQNTVFRTDLPTK